MQVIGFYPHATSAGVFGINLSGHGMDEKRGPLKMLRTKGLAQAQSTRLYIFILVIQDHIESIGKPILLKGDEVLLNGFLAQSA